MALFSLDNLRLLRLTFSVFLLPIFAFSLLATKWMGLPLHVGNTWLIFGIVHLLVYPASNAYNSWMDQDTGPIGGLKNPPPARRSLYHLTLLLDGLALLLACLLVPQGWLFPLLVAGYIGVSKAYSWRGIRLKKYPWLAWLTVGAVQGSYTFLLFVWSIAARIDFPWLPMGLGMGAAFLLVGATYPLTQVFQHTEDRDRGDRTLSLLLGIRGTFLLAGALFGLGFACLGGFFYTTGHAAELPWLLLGTSPAAIYLGWWAVRCWRDPSAANWSGALWMNIWAAASLTTTFGLLAVS